MTPLVTLETSTVERMKLYAEPLVDTLDTVILKGLDAIDLIKAGENKTERVLNPAAPPNLAFTTVKSIVFNGKRFPAGEVYWNTLLLAVVREAGKLMDSAKLDQLIKCNHMVGKKEDNGYKYIGEVNMSVQGQDANHAWSTIYAILLAIKMPTEVNFVWQDNPKAAMPSAPGKLVVTFD